MGVLYGEGVAIHVGPESCVGVREGVGEALTGVRAGWAIEPRNLNEVRGADAVTRAEGHTGSGVIASRWRTPRGLGTWARTESPCARTGRSHGYPSRGAGREGKAEAVLP
jgi:RNA-directed DNA polymerase